MNRSLRDGVSKRGLIWYGVTGLLFAGLLYFADVDQFLTALGQVDVPLFSIAVGVGFTSLLVWAWVWYRFFGQLEIESSVSQTVRMFLTGHFLNSITPLGQFGGEPIMAYIISDTTGSDYENSLACVVSSDIVNALPFFTFPIGGILYLSVVGTVQGFLVEVGLVAVSILTVGSVLAYFLWSDTGRLGDFLITVLDLLEDRIGRAGDVFESLRGSVDKTVTSFEKAGSDPRFLLETATISHLAILAQIVSLYFVFLAMEIDPRVVPLYFIVTLSTIATLSPTPGGSGTYEAAFSALMTVFYSVDFATALSAAVLFRLTTYWPGILVGFVSFLTLDSQDNGDENSQQVG
jgi:hypothetical protein